MVLQRLGRLLSRRPDRRGLLAAVLAVAAAAALSVLVGALIEPGAPAVFLAAVVVSAWYGGLWPGLLATGLAALVGEVVFFAPLYGLSSGAGIRVVSFVVVATLVASLYEAARQAQAAPSWRCTRSRRPGPRPSRRAGPRTGSCHALVRAAHAAERAGAGYGG